MKKLYLLFILILAGQFVFSQLPEVELFYDNFESGSANWSLNTSDMGSVGSNGANQWIINNIYAGGTYNLGGFFPVTIPSTPNQPAQITNSPQSQYLHIVCGAALADGVGNANFVDGFSSSIVGGEAGANFAKMNVGINTSGISDVTLSFWWLCNGAKGSVWYSTDGGTSWKDLGANYTNVSNWTFATFVNPEFDNQADLRFAFMFDNNVSGGDDPAFSVDEVRVFYTPTSNFSLSMSSTENTKCDGFGCNYDGPSILINEVMLSPNTGDGSIYSKSPDSRGGEWIELYNPDRCQSIDISCYFLGNNAKDQDGIFSQKDFPGGYVIPEGTIIPPQGFCVIRGVNAPAVNSQYLVQNGGKTVEIVVDDPSRVCLGGGSRLWFPNAGGWFAFYDRNGVPQDAISWGSQSNSCMSCYPCNPGVIGSCGYAGSLLPYDNIPSERKTIITYSTPATGLSYMRIPDGGAWSSYGENQTIGFCNSVCDPEPEITCTGTASAIVSGGEAPYTYKWSDGMAQTTQTAVGLCEGTYCVTVTDAENNTLNACVDVKNVTFDISTSGDAAMCQGETFTFEATNLENHKYKWNGPNNFSSTSSNNTISNVTTAMSGTYTVTVTDEGGCIATSSTKLTVYPAPDIVISAEKNIICMGESTTITAQGGVNYAWDNDLPASATHIISPTTTTTYNVTATASNDCQNTASITITVAPLPEIVASADPSSICAGEQTTIIASGGTAYVWDNNLGAGVSHNISPSETTIYSVTGTDENFCSSTANIEIVVHEAFTVQVQPENPELCMGESILLSVSTTAENPSFMWNSNQQTEQISISPSSSTSYIVTVTDKSNCKGIDSVYVVVNPKPEVDFSSNVTNGCEPLYVEFVDVSQDNSIIEWNWDFGDASTSTQQNPSNTYPEGKYTVTLLVTNTYGCKDTLKITNYIEAYPQPIADFTFSPDYGTADNPEITFTSTSDAQYWNWNFGDGENNNEPNSTIHKYPSDDASYTVTLILSNNYGCADTITKEIKIIDNKFPNVITPNGDGINDKLEITNAEKIPNTKLVVFNRWGNKVFEQTNYQNDWDGGNLPDGTYYYVFYYYDKEHKSSLTIIR